jgi:hypothetical protein
MRLAFAGFLVLHGAIHLMGFAKAFGYAELAQLKVPISPAMGVTWALAALAFAVAAVTCVTSPRWWWAPAVVGVVLSMAALVPSWGDAKVGAVANVVVLAAAVAGCLVDGPWSQRAAYARDVARLAVTGEPPAIRVVTEADLAGLPAPVQRYLRVSGVVGHPRVESFRVRMHGRIRSGPGAGWMPLVAEQVNTISPPARLFYLDAWMLGLPVTGYHRFAAGAASMRVKAVGLVPVADDAGPALTRAETVTFFNDLCLMAPATLVAPAIVWTAIDDRHARAHFTAGAHTIAAELTFGADGRLVDFWSDDRGRPAAGGAGTEGQRWSTPITAYRRFGDVTLIGHGEARWHPPSGPYAYIELDIDDITMNVVSR